MNISPLGCEYYALVIESDPTVPASDWLLSLDDGDTWVAASVIGGVASWLVAGAEYTPEPGVQPDFVITNVVTPLLKAVDSPETLIRRAPKIVPVTPQQSRGC